MSDKSKKIIAVEIIVLVILLTVFGIRHYNKIITIAPNREINEGQQTTEEVITQDFVQQELGELRVSFLDVGKGDCILIETTQGAIMVDTGYDENGEDIISWLDDKGVDSLEYLILTHPDKDHIGGADIVINNIEIKNIIETNCEVNNDDYIQYQQAAADKGIDILTLIATKDVSLGGANLTLYPPLSNNFKGQNDYSIVIKMIYGETDFLFAGDAEDARIEELLTQIPNINSMLLKVPHHGTLMQNSEELFEAISPQYSIITSDKDEIYQGVTEMLENLDSKVYTTKDGDILITSDGTKMTIDQ